MSIELSEKLHFLKDNARFKALFLLLLRTDDYMKSEDLAKELGVTSRTIKRDLKFLREELYSNLDIILESKQSKGYKLEIKSAELEGKIKEYFQIYQSTTIDSDFNNRVEFILRKLLVTIDPIKIEVIQNELCININNSLNKELHKVKKILYGYDLKLIVRPHYGVHIEGLNFNKTMLIVRMYKYFNRRVAPVFGIREFDDLFKCEIAEKEYIRKMFYSTITKSRIVFSDIYAERFIVNLIYLRNKWLSGERNLLELENIDFDYKVTDEYELVYELIHKLRNQINGFDFSEECLKFLTYIAVMSTDLYRFKDCTAENYDSLLELSEEIRNYLIRQLSSYLQIDIFNDYICIKDLLKIIIPISLKMKLNISDDTDLGFHDMRSVEDKPILLHYITKLRDDFYSKYGYLLSPREQYLIFNVFLGMLNRIVLAHRKLTLAIIAIDGRLGAQQLKFNLQHYFSEHIEKIDTKVLYELDSMTNRHYDYYLCTNYGRNMNIAYSPIYFAEEGIKESQYVDSLSQIFFGAYEYDRVLPPVSFVEINSKYKFEIFPIENYLQQHCDYEHITILKENGIQIYFNFKSSKEEFKLLYFDNADDMTLKCEQFFIIVNLNINEDEQKLKMILNIFDRIVEDKEILKNFCNRHEPTYKNFFMTHINNQV
jgi:lichenan operon transcriptional antiterminator